MLPFSVREGRHLRCRGPHLYLYSIGLKKSIRMDKFLFVINSFMILLEFYDPVDSGWQSLEDDRSKPEWGEARKTKLTLGMINKMRKMKEVQSYERAKDLKKIIFLLNFQLPKRDNLYLFISFG